MLGVDVAHEDCEVGAGSEAGEVVDDVCAGFGGAVVEDEGEVEVDEVEGCVHCCCGVSFLEGYG